MTEEEYLEFKRERTQKLEEIASTFKAAPFYSKAVMESDSYTVLIGLPHQTWESEKFKKEQGENRTIEGQFYTDNFELSDADATVIKALLGTGKIFEKWSGWKDCGGFHADYRVICESPNKKTEFDICFGCGEIDARSNGSGKMHVNMAKAHVETLKNLLEKFTR